MSRKLLLTIVSLLLVSIVLLGAMPGVKKEEVRIHLWRDQGSVITISQKDKPYLAWGWGNCSHGLTLDWIASTEMNISLFRGEELVQEIAIADGYWDDPYQSDPHPLCLHGDGTTWITLWRFEKLKFKPGEYRLESEIATTVPLTDGFDYEPDGFLNITPARTWEPTDITIIVTN